MKTMKRGDEIVRVKESEVKSKLTQGFDYCKKSEWKEKVRDVKKQSPTESTEVATPAAKKKGKQTPKGKAKKQAAK